MNQGAPRGQPWFLLVFRGELGTKLSQPACSAVRWVAGVESRRAGASPQSAGLGPGGVALRSPTPATLDRNLPAFGPGLVLR